MKFNFSLGLIAFLFFIGYGCKEKQNNIINVKLDSIYVDTSIKIGPFRDIKTVSKVYDSVNKRLEMIHGIIKLEESALRDAQHMNIKVDLYLKEGKRIVKIDADRDGSLADEQEYIVNDKSRLITFPDVEIKIGGKRKIITLYGYPMQSGLYKPKDKYDLSFIGVSVLWIRNSGQFYFKNTYQITATKVPETIFSYDGVRFNITEVGGKNDEEIVYKVGDILHLDRNILKLIDIDSSISILKVEKIGTEAKQYGYLVGDYAVPLNGLDVLTNKEVLLKDEPGKLTLLEFWGTWCGPCTKLTGEYLQLESQYRGSLKIIGIASDQSRPNVEKYLKEKKVGYQNIYEKFNDTICTKYVVRNFPTFILIDSDGKIIFRAYGLDYFSDLKEMIRKKLKVGEGIKVNP